MNTFFLNFPFFILVSSAIPISQASSLSSIVQDPDVSHRALRIMAEPSDSSVTSTVVAPGFSKLARNELSQLRQGITVAEWCKAHPDDSLVFFDYRFDDPSNQEWCIRAEKRVQLLPSRQIAVRYAYFYVPLPSPALSLPPLGDSLRVRTTEAVLGMIWVEVIERSVQASAIIVDSVRNQLSEWLGAGTIDPKMAHPLGDGELVGKLAKKYSLLHTASRLYITIHQQ